MRQDSLESRLEKQLQICYPFTEAFIGRVDRIVPFLPMSGGDPEIHPLFGEMITVAKLLIEREQEKLERNLGMEQRISASTKESMAKIIVSEAVVEGGVRAIKKLVEKKVGKKVRHQSMLERGGIAGGSKIQFSASEPKKMIDFRVQEAKSAPAEDQSKDADVGFDLKNEKIDDCSDNELYD
jgi:ATP-dependent Clp protease ATP-binding subunit ClpA